MSATDSQSSTTRPPEGAAVQAAGDPLPDVSAQELAEQLGSHPSDAALAEAISLTTAKVGHLMHLADEDERLVDELGIWLDLEKELCQRALAVLVRDGVEPGKDPGMMRAIAPFMERNGYADACGWWVRVEEDESLPEVDGFCPACGAQLDDFIEGSCMGQRCPICGWSVVATYLPPIQLDEREYTITLLPGCAPAKDALKAVSRLMMCNYLDARRMMRGAPMELFSGRAPAVLEHMRALDEAGVPIAVTPDFPYDAEGQLA